MILNPVFRPATVSATSLTALRARLTAEHMLIAALLIGAMFSPPLLIVALGLTLSLVVHQRVPMTHLGLSVTRTLLFAAISLAVGLGVTAALSCIEGLFSTAAVYLLFAFRR